MCKNKFSFKSEALKELSDFQVSELYGISYHLEKLIKYLKDYESADYIKKVINGILNLNDIPNDWLDDANFGLWVNDAKDSVNNYLNSYFSGKNSKRILIDFVNESFGNLLLN